LSIRLTQEEIEKLAARGYSVEPDVPLAAWLRRSCPIRSPAALESSAESAAGSPYGENRGRRGPRLRFLSPRYAKLRAANTGHSLGMNSPRTRTAGLFLCAAREHTHCPRSVNTAPQGAFNSSQNFSEIRCPIGLGPAASCWDARGYFCALAGAHCGHTARRQLAPLFLTSSFPPRSGAYSRRAFFRPPTPVYASLRGGIPPE
jgi:hypothetical protein